MNTDRQQSIERLKKRCEHEAGCAIETNMAAKCTCGLVDDLSTLERDAAVLEGLTSFVDRARSNANWHADRAHHADTRMWNSYADALAAALQHAQEQVGENEV